ncbi:hepatic sodium/bile acid cotransporter-like [Boleophthalmus pectinirostris]|uniref:hepatic sodium/bile acid cotransporter-like n=1 Tax=Boleophthalmus pectinirostris TaxID=150288 RepID=UPI00242EDA42|nr:hepatic sodium/bile acid cotransporter-like [Boleophthalmus pectinirostris]
MIGSMFVTMVSLGCTMEVTKIKDHIVKPKGVGIALVAQFGIMPLTAFILAKVFQLSEMAAVVVLICGCCPGGLLSNVTSLVIKGDMNLSIVMTTCSTLLALGMMPLLLLVYCQGIEGLQEAVPYGDIALTLLTIVFPCGIGILLNHYRPQYSNFIRKAGLTVSSIGFLVVIGLTILDNGDEALGVLAPSIVAIAVLMPITGYTLGYLLSLLFRLTQPECRTVSMETGCQNAGLAMTVIKVVFPPEAVGPLVLFPVAYVLTQLSEALLLVLLFRTHLHWQQRKNKKGVYQAASPEMQEVGVSEKSC